MTKNDIDPVNQLIEKAKPQISKLTFGGVVGYCSGAAAKKVGKAIAVLAGLTFIAIQSAVHTGYISVDWDKIKDDAVAKVDTVSLCTIYMICFALFYLYKNIHDFILSNSLTYC